MPPPAPGSGAGPMRRDQGVWKARQPIAVTYGGEQGIGAPTAYCLTQDRGLPASIGVGEALPRWYRTSPLIPSQLHWFAATITNPDPPRPDQGGYWASASHTLVPGQFGATRVTIANPEPPRPEPGGWFAASSRTLVSSQFGYPTATVAASEPYRPEPNWTRYSAGHALVTAPSLRTWSAYVDRDSLRPTPDPGRASWSSSRTFVATQFTRPTVSVDSDPLQPAPYPGGATWQASQTLIPAQFTWGAAIVCVNPEMIPIPEGWASISMAMPPATITITEFLIHDPFTSASASKPVNPFCSTSRFEGDTG